jgi:hypothetical protein
LLDESEREVHMRVADVFFGHNNHTNVIVIDFVGVIHDGVCRFVGVIHDGVCRFNVISDATNAKLIAIDTNVAEHSRNNWDVVHACNVGQHNASGDINPHERDSRCRDSFH